MTLSAGTRLGPYEILSPIGAGGMGEVYRARDTRLARDVAVKVLPEKFSADPERLSRFEREARAASALSDPHIVTVFDIGEENGTPYFVSELVDGIDLRTLLSKERLPVRKTLDLAQQIASGLAAAHEKGIVHRDLKPENILITKTGTAKVGDFGLAKLTETRETVLSQMPTTDRAITVEGSVMGTVAYMSPEQARGADVDFRTDQFSFGSLLYEMLTGKRPFEKETSHQTLTGIIEQDPPPIVQLNPSVPEPLCWIVERCLAKDPDERYGSTRDLARDLKHIQSHSSEPSVGAEEPVKSRVHVWAVWAAVLALAGILAVAGVLFLTGSRRGSISSLAVLPFSNASSDPSAEYLSDGITDSLINNLSQLPKFQVMAHSTVFSFRGRATDPRQIGRELHVGAVLTGRLVQRGDTLVVAAELVDVSNGAQLWGEQYNRKLSEIFAVQDEIASEIADKLKVKLTGEDKKGLTKRYTENTAAYQAYLRGRYYAGKYTEEGWKKAFEYFHQAIEIDPTYALAYAGLTVACWNVSNLQKAPREVMPQAEAAARKAVEIDDELAEAHASLALVEMAYGWDRPAAEKEYRRAIELKPGYASVHQWYGWHLALLGRLDEAIAEMKRAQRLDPLSGEISAYVGLSYYWARDYGKAIEQLRKSLELDPDSWFSHGLLGWAYLQNGQSSEAFEEIKKSRELDNNQWALADLGHAYAVSGKRAEAEKVLEELRERAKQRYVSKYLVARIYAGLGEKEKAFEWMEKAFEDRDESETWLKVDPMMDSLHSDPRYAKLLRRLGLPA